MEMCRRSISAHAVVREWILCERRFICDERLKDVICVRDFCGIVDFENPNLLAHSAKVDANKTDDRKDPHTADACLVSSHKDLVLVLVPIYF